MAIINIPVAPATVRAISIGTTTASLADSSLNDQYDETDRINGTGTFSATSTDYEVGDEITATFLKTDLSGFGSFSGVGDHLLLRLHSGAAGTGTLLGEFSVQERGNTGRASAGTTEDLTLRILRTETAKSGGAPVSVSIAAITTFGVETIAASVFNENYVLRRVTFTGLAAAGINAVGQEVRITTTPASLVADAEVMSIDTTTGVVDLRIEDVTTARGPAPTQTQPYPVDLSAFSIALISRDGVIPGTTTITTGSGGFVTAIFNGSDRASNTHKDGLTLSFGPASEKTSYRVQEGTAIPGATTGSPSEIVNTNLEEFNILINQ